MRFLPALAILALLSPPAIAQSAFTIDREPVDAPPAGAMTTIEIAPAEPLAPIGVGLLDSDKGGFPATLWRGSDAATLQGLMDGLQLPPDSPATAALIRRLLLSSAEAPPADGARPDFTASRIGALTRLGFSTDAAALGRALPESAAAARAAAAGNALLDDPAQGCADARAAGATADTQARKLRIVCDILDGKPDSAQLGLDLLREQKLADPQFDRLAALALGAKGETPEIKDADPVTLLLLRAAKRPLPKSLATASGPAVSRALIEDATQPPAARRAMAARLAAAGLLSDGDIAALSGRGLTQTEAERSALRDAARRRDGRCPLPAKGDAAKAFDSALAAAAYSEPADKAALTAQSLALDALRTGGLAEFRVKQIASLMPEDRFAAYAVCFAGAALAAGDPVLAEGWLDLAAAQPGERAAAELNRLWPLEAIAKGQNVDPRDISIWLGSLPAAAPASTTGRVLAILSATGQDVPDSAWAQLPPEQKALAAGGLADPRLGRLTAQSQAGRIGETALMAAAIIGNTAPSAKPTAEVTGIISGLRRVGAAADARNIALEVVAPLVLN